MSAPFKILVTMAAVAVCSTGAFAQVTKGFDGNTVYETRLSNFPNARSARASYSATLRPSLKSNSVYAPNGYYLGSDPDANVRLGLLRDQCYWGC